MCILCVYTLLKVVNHYDFSVLSMLVMGSQKNILDLFAPLINLPVAYLSRFGYG